MADGDVPTSQQEGQNERFRSDRGPREGANRGPRDGGNRDAGGFRIRLSDNEMRAARAVQEAFGLRSTVAALGLSIRTVAQLLDEGKLDEAVAQHRASAGNRPPRERRDGGRDGARDGARNERGGSRPNPFARPARPAAAAPVAEAEPAPELAHESTAVEESSVDRHESEATSSTEA